MNLNGKAQRFLNVYSDNGTLEEGLAFSKALQQSRLDFSESSLQSDRQAG